MLFRSETIRRPGFGDARSDLYALAAVGHVLLTGRPLFDGGTAEEIWLQQERATPGPPSRLAPGPVSGALDDLLLCCLAKAAEERPPTMDAFLSRLLACPEAGAWTEPMREAWWSQHAPPDDAASGDAADIGQATVMMPATRSNGGR